MAGFIITNIKFKKKIIYHKQVSPTPASVYCEKQGGKLEIIKAADGSESGTCVFSDGSKCDEWAFYRSECKIGKSIGTSTVASTADTSGWKTYHDEKYGISFKYPDDLKITENYSADTGELKIDLVSTNRQTKSSVGITPKISISSVCLVPENVPKKYWEDGDFQNPPIALPIFKLLSKFLKTYEINTRKLYVFNQDCYECYDFGNTRDVQNDYDGYSTYSCEAGLNKNGNKTIRCLTIIAERQKIDSPELEEL